MANDGLVLSTQASIFLLALDMNRIALSITLAPPYSTSVLWGKESE
jgi:hypothetical protein